MSALPRYSSFDNSDTSRMGPLEAGGSLHRKTAKRGIREGTAVEPSLPCSSAKETEAVHPVRLGDLSEIVGQVAPLGLRQLCSFR